MSVPFQYWGSAMHESADLKRTIKRVRAARPDLFKVVSHSETSMDGDGKVMTTVRKDARAVAPTGARRHAMALQKAWH